MFIKIFACVVTLLLGNYISAALARTPLKNGDRICFLGDSITEFGIGPAGYVTLLRQKLGEKYPHEHIEVVGSGVAGNKIEDLEKRVDRDVIAIEPSIVVIYIGINDVWAGLYEPTLVTSTKKFRQSLENLINKIQTSGARVILCTPTVIGEKIIGTNPLDADLDRISEVIRIVAKEHRLELVDLRTTFTKYENRHNPENQSEGILTVGGVHLNEKGEQLVCDTILDVFN